MEQEVNIRMIFVLHVGLTWFAMTVEHQDGTHGLIRIWKRYFTNRRISALIFKEDTMARIVRNEEVQKFKNEVSFEVENLLYDFGLKDWMLQDKITDLIIEKYCEVKGIEL